MKATKSLPLFLAMALLFGGMSIPGCNNQEQAAQLQSLNADMTTTKQILQQLLTAMENQNRRIAAMEMQLQARAPSKPAAASKPAPAKKAAKPPKHR